MVRAALEAGLLGVFIGFIIMPLIGLVSAGVLAVYFYRRENGLLLPAALGARLGGAAGVVSFAISALVLAIRVFVFHGPEFADFIAHTTRTAGLNATDTDTQAVLHFLFSPPGLVIIFFFVMIVAVVIASIGGMAASWFLKPRNNRV